MATEDGTYKRGVSFQDDVQWALGGTASTLSGFSTASIDIRDRPRNTLQYIPKREEKSQRPILAATMGEIFCYFRMYTTSISKTQLIAIIEKEINWFVWVRILNLIFGSMPRVFLQAFLAAYVPEEHFYLDKMSPLTYGYNFTVILAAFFEFGIYVNNCAFLLDFVWEGLAKKSPWNTCPRLQETLFGEEATYLVRCLTLEQFGRAVKAGNASNETFNFVERVYFFGNASAENVNRTYFQLSQLLYFAERITLKFSIYKNAQFMLYFMLIWITAALHYLVFFKKPIWKILKVVHYIEASMTFSLLIYLYFVDDVVRNYSPKKVLFPAKKWKDVMVDVDILALSLNAPPVAHVLIARTATDHSKVQYNSLSLLLVFSNFIYGLAMTILSTSVKRYCESTLGAEIRFSDLNSLGYYYFFPIFFSRFTIGNLMFIFYTLAKFFGEFYCFIVTYHILVETIACEWKVATRLLSTAGIVIAALIVYILIDYHTQVAIYLASKCVVIIVEVLGVYLLYPLGRLIEDMTFHNGRPTNTLRIWSLRMVPIYIGVKMYTTPRNLSQLNYFRQFGLWAWLVPVVPIGLGLIYIMIMHIFVEKRKWTLLFCPEPEWGPTDSVLRYCRKLYRSDEYIGSQADRNLSRYMISKSEAEVYRLDVRYDAPRRSSTPQTAAMRYEDENQKKNV